MKKKILINLVSDLFLRNYILNNSFEKIENEYECFYMASNDSIFLKDKLINKKNFLGFYSHNSKAQKKFRNLYLRNYFEQRNKTRAILNNLRLILKPKLKYESENIFGSILNFIPRMLSNFKRRSYLYLTNLFIIKYFLKRIETEYTINGQINSFIENLKPDLIISPIQGNHIGHYETIIAAKQKNITSITLIDNWDNLSSKPMLKPTSDYFFVWGEQSLEHANIFHKIDKSKIKIIGTPRFNHYFETREQNLKSHFDFKYILYLESWGVGNFSLRKGDEDALQRIDKIIENNKEFFKKVKIVFRPYPWRKSKDTIDFSKFKNIIIDPQLIDNYKKRKFDTSIQPDLNYYPSLIKNAEMIIAGPTSMVIESVIFRKQTLLLAQSYNQFLSHGSFFKNSEHFDNIERIGLISTCLNIDDLEKKLFNCYENINNKDLIERCDKERNYFLYNDNYSYKERLIHKISEVI